MKTKMAPAAVKKIADKLTDSEKKKQKQANKLKANPEKDYIYWPNRYEKIDAFADKLYKIMNGE